MFCHAIIVFINGREYYKTLKPYMIHDTVTKRVVPLEMNTIACFTPTSIGFNSILSYPQHYQSSRKSF